MLWLHKPWGGSELYLQVDKGRLVSQDHSVTSFIAHELILLRIGELARPVSIVGKILWESRKIIKIAPLPCNFLALKAICPYHYTMPSAVWRASIGLNVFTWFLLLLRSFALLGANPFSFQFSKIQYFFWQVIWYGYSRVISNGEPSGSSVYEVWMRVGTRRRTLLTVPSLKWATLRGLSVLTFVTATESPRGNAQTALECWHHTQKHNSLFKCYLTFWCYSQLETAYE